MPTTAINAAGRGTHGRAGHGGRRSALLGALVFIPFLSISPAIGNATDESPDAPERVAAAMTDGAKQSPEVSPIRLIGATAIVTEVSSGLPFAARVDTGATSCSIHCEEVEIVDPADDPKNNVGKLIRFLVRNKDGEAEWVESKIADHVTVRTSKYDDDRYKVPLKLRWEDVEKRVLVTLNDRERMQYPLLLGRNFLRGDFVVDVNLDDEN